MPTVREKVATRFISPPPPEGGRVTGSRRGLRLVGLPRCAALPRGVRAVSVRASGGSFVRWWCLSCWSSFVVRAALLRCLRCLVGVWAVRLSGLLAGRGCVCFSAVVGLRLVRFAGGWLPSGRFCVVRGLRFSGGGLRGFGLRASGLSAGFRAWLSGLRGLSSGGSSGFGLSGPVGGSGRFCVFVAAFPASRSARLSGLAGGACLPVLAGGSALSGVAGLAGRGFSLRAGLPGGGFGFRRGFRRVSGLSWRFCRPGRWAVAGGGGPLSLMIIPYLQLRARVRRYGCHLRRLSRRLRLARVRYL